MMLQALACPTGAASRVLGGGIYRGRYPVKLSLLSLAQSNRVLPTWSRCPFPRLSVAYHLSIFSKQYPTQILFYLILSQYETVKNVQITGMAREPIPPQFDCFPTTSLIRRSTDQLFFCLCSNCS